MIKAENTKDLLVLFVVGVIVWLAYFGVNFIGLVAPDALYYASIARNLVRGDGYHANVISPILLSYLGTNAFVPLVNPPLFPYLLALLFKIGGVSSWAPALATSFFYLVSVIPLYLISIRLFGRSGAVITSLVYLFEPTMLYLSISGLTEPVFICFLLMGFLFLLLFFEDEKWVYGFLTGVCIGLCKLIRFNANVFIIAIAVALIIFLKERRVRAVGLFAVGVILVNVPELIRFSAVKTQSLTAGLLNYGAIDGTDQYPLTTLGRILNPMTSWEYIRTFPRDFLYKYIDNLFYYCKNFFTMTNPIITAFFTVSLFSFKNDRMARPFLFIIGLSILVQMVLISYNIAIIRYFYVFIPFVIIFGVGYFFERIYEAKPSLTYKSFLMLLAIIFFLTTVRPHTIFITGYRVLFRNYETKEALFVKQQRMIGDFVREHTKKDDFIATDFTSIGWYADRKTLWLPISFDVLETIDSKYKKVDAILVTSASDVKDVTKLTGVAKNLVEWKNILDNPPERWGKYVLFKQGDIRGEKFVFYKREGG